MEFVVDIQVMAEVALRQIRIFALSVSFREYFTLASTFVSKTKGPSLGTFKHDNVLLDIGEHWAQLFCHFL
jgi:hypothetical protein